MIWRKPSHQHLSLPGISLQQHLEKLFIDRTQIMKIQVNIKIHQQKCKYLFEVNVFKSHLHQEARSKSEKRVCQVSAVTEGLPQNIAHFSKLSNAIRHRRTHITYMFLKIELEWYLKSSVLIISKRYAQLQSRNTQCTTWSVCSNKAFLILNEWNKEMLGWKRS